MPLSQNPPVFTGSTLAYNTATASLSKSVITTPSASSQTVNPMATPYIHVVRPTNSTFTLNLDLLTNYVGAGLTQPNVYAQTQVTAPLGYRWFVSFVPATGGNQLAFAVTSPASGTSITWDSVSGAPTGVSTFAVYEFYTADGVNVKGRTVVAG